MLDMLRRADQRVHQDDEVVSAVTLFLVMKQKIRKSLFEAHHRPHFI
jgi:hypothetical protein